MYDYFFEHIFYRSKNNVIYKVPCSIWNRLKSINVNCTTGNQIQNVFLFPEKPDGKYRKITLKQFKDVGLYTLNVFNLFSK